MTILSIPQYKNFYSGQELQQSDVQIRRDIETVLADKAHPEKYLILMRNALWAKKLFFIGEELRRRGIEHPRIGIIAGFYHRYLDYFLRHEGKIDGIISGYSGLMERSVLSKEYIYGILELNLREGSFSKQFMVVPELQKAYLEKESSSTESKG